MILADIKRYLQERGQATLADIAIHFDSNPDAVRGMLEIWIRKGKVRMRPVTSSCGDSCHQCDSSTTEIYQWMEAESHFRNIPITPVGCDKV
ncbi:MAG: sugar metabolism transcriptional regulator [Sedimenticola sp.]|nr:MAG: sugar metabolism transcriptional regulator [Sedimenticola sp.]